MTRVNLTLTGIAPSEATIVDEETYLASRQVARAGDNREIDDLKPGKNTHRLR
ncbi:hypothetical protein YT03_000374 [Salmonella enterica subsp. enterica]|nr:hypothetical protein [Salmonella enterica subsp. enterica serovar Sandiego]